MRSVISCLSAINTTSTSQAGIWVNFLQLVICYSQLTHADSDAVMKNPFQAPEMPINSSLFESRLQTLITEVNA